MRKNLLKSMIALAAFCMGTMTAWAQNPTGTGTVKMTYIDYDQQEVPMGQLDTIRAGYNKAAAVGSAIGFGNTGWGENKIGVLKADVSSIPGTVQKATLKAKISGSSDSKRTTAWGVALTDNAWAADLTYATAGAWTVSALLNGGNQVWTATKAATVFEDAEWDITAAFEGGKSVATILVYETAAAGGYMTEPTIEVEYESFDATTTKYDFEDGNKVFTDDRRVTSAIENDATLGSNVIGWTCAGNAQNDYSFSHYDFTSLLNQPALVAVEFDYYNTNGGRAILNLGDALVRGTTGGSSKVTYNKTGVAFRIGSDKTNFYINDTKVQFADATTTETVVDEETGEESTVETVTPGFTNKWLHVSVMANIDAKTVTWVITDQEGNVLHQGSEAFYADDCNAVSQIDLFGYINNSHCAMLDNLTITNYKSNAVFADYTIKYVDAAGNELKEARTGNGQVGKFVTLLDADKASIYAEDNSMKYIYESDNAAEVAIAEDGSAVIEVKFREAEKFYAVLNCLIEGTTTVLQQIRDDNTQWFWEGDTYSLYPTRGIAHEGKYYFCEATSWNGATYSFPGPLTPRTVGGQKMYIGTLNYAPVDSVAYYSDFERLALPVEDEGNGTGLGYLKGTVNSWYSFSGGYFDRFSGARGIRLDAGSYVWTEPIAEDGTYKLTVYGRNDISAGQPNPYQLGYTEDGGATVTWFDIAIPEWASATTGTNIVEAVGVKAGWQLVFGNDEEAKKISLDDLSMTKVGEYAETPTKAPAGDVTYALVEGATFTSGQVVNVENEGAVVATIQYGEEGEGYADFGAAKADEHVEGYTAFTEGNGVNGNKAGGTFYTIVPKYKGVVAVAIVLNNGKAFHLLVDGVENDTFNGNTVDEKYYGPVVFNVEAGKAYKFYCAGSKLGFYGFNYKYGDDVEQVEEQSIADQIATGIENVVTFNAESGAIYNLNGQEVSGALTKGLYIMNGKKFIVK